MTNKDFQYSFTTTKSKQEVFRYLLNPVNWWNGLYGETIAGNSIEINDQFSFRAGDGVHYTNQQLVEKTADSKLVWLVTESKLSFLQQTNEWDGTKICFDIEQEGGETKVTFTHKGLVPEIECYGSCSAAWGRYLHNLEAYFNA